MRRWSRIALAVGCLPLLTASSVRAHSGSSPEAAVEALLAQQSDTPRWLKVDDAQIQALVPACEQAIGQAEDSHHKNSMSAQLELSGCVSTMQKSLGWLEEGAFAACPDEGISKERADACSSAVLTFLLQHQQDNADEDQTVASLALMKDLCGSPALCAPMVSPTQIPDA